MSLVVENEFDSDASLAAITRLKIDEFRVRRLTLTAVRGAAQVFVVAFIALVVAIVLDAYAASAWASLAFYGCLIPSLIYCLGRKLWTKHNLTEEARRFERANRNLRELLLPAVELSSQHSSGTSAAFCAKVQSDAAEAVSMVDVREVLPWYVIRRPLQAAAISLGFVFVGCCLPNLYFFQRSARVLLPWANLGRVSSIAISIVRPQPHSKTVPQGDMVSIVAQIRGKVSSGIVLETRSGRGKMEFSMLPHTGQNTGAKKNSSLSHFQTMISVDQDRVEYRVVGHDASTPWYWLEAVPRPSVDQLRAEVTFPRYADQPSQTVEFMDARTVVLQGSQVQLQVQTDRNVSRAELRWEPGDGKIDRKSDEVTELRFDTMIGAWVANFSVEVSRRFKVFLVEDSTGLTNEYGRTYSILAKEDTAPEVRWVNPATTTVVASSGDVLSLVAHVTDDLPSSSVRGFFRINSGEWTSAEVTFSERDNSSDETSLGKYGLFRTSVQWSLDLLSHKLSPGDRIEVKLQATDRKGQTSESDILDISISSARIAYSLNISSQMRLNIAERLEELAKKIPLAAAAESQSDSMAKEVVEGLKKDISPLIGLIAQASVITASHVEKTQLRLVGYSLARLVRLLDTPAAGGEQTQQTASDVAVTIASEFRTAVSADVLRFLAAQLSELATEQKILVEGEGELGLSPIQMARRQMVISLQLREVQQVMLDSMVSLREQSSQRVLQATSLTSSLLAQVDRERGKVNIAALRHNARSISAALDRLSSAAMIDPTLPEAIAESHGVLIEQSGYSSESILSVADAYDRNDGEVSYQLSTEELSTRRMVRRATSTGQNRYSADLGAAKRAVDFICQAMTRETGKGSVVGALNDLRRVANAVATLEGVDAYEQSARTLAALKRMEQLAVTTKLSDSQLGMWSLYLRQLEDAAKRIAAANKNFSYVVAALDKGLQHARNSSVESILRRRENETEFSLSVLSDVETMHRELASLRDDLSNLAKAARDVLDEFAPSISELARDAAEATNDVSLQSQQLADSIARGEVPDPQTRISQLDHDVVSLDDPISELQDALVDQAEMQDLLEKDQIEKSRSADVALEIANNAGQTLQQSMGRVDSEDSSARQREALRFAASEQEGAAEAFRAIADHYDSGNESQLVEQRDANEVSSATSKESSPTDGDASDASQQSPWKTRSSNADYEQAEELAELAAASPEDLLHELEKQLKYRPAMRQELSAIARQAVKQALSTLELAGEAERKQVPMLENSDARINAEKTLLLHDIGQVEQQVKQLLEYLVSEAAWTTGAAGESGSEANVQFATKAISVVTKLLDDEFGATSKLERSTTISELLVRASQSRQTLMDVAVYLKQAQQLLAAETANDSHSSEADLQHRRREMKDRARRSHQQVVRQLRQLENYERQHFRSADMDFAEVAKARASLEDRLSSLEPTAASSELKHRLRQIRIVESEAKRVVKELQERLIASQQRVAHWNGKVASPLDSGNPSAELARDYLVDALESAEYLLGVLNEWKTRPYEVRATEDALSALLTEQDAVATQMSGVAESLARASRHELRLEKVRGSERLEEVATQTRRITDNVLELNSVEVSDALLHARKERMEGSVGQRTSGTILRRLSEIVTDTGKITESLRALLEGEEMNVEAAPGNSEEMQSPPESPLDANALARLLDELDQQINGETKLGEKEDDSQAAPASTENSSKKTNATPLSEAAQQLAQKMSRSRQQPLDGPTDDVAMATDAQVADASPQGPVNVQMVDVSRLDGVWGELRQQTSDESVDSVRDVVLPTYRDQIEAYFREVARQGWSGSVKATK